MDVLSLHRRKRVWVALLGCLLLCQPLLAAPTREYQLKAAFIFNFIKFVEWPSSSGPINVGILGDDPFVTELKKLETKNVGGRAVKVSTVKDLAQAKSYQVVYSSDPTTAAKLIKAVEGHPVLTISDTPGFSQKGGGITLMSSKNRIRFAINTATLEKSSLKASSKLLGLAEKLYSLSEPPRSVVALDPLDTEPGRQARPK